MIGIAIRNPDPKVYSGFFFTTAGQIGAVVTKFAGSAISAPLAEVCDRDADRQIFFGSAE